MNSHSVVIFFWKNKKCFLSAQKWGFGESGIESSEIQSPECQELSVSPAATTLITEMRSETPKVDLANKVMGNHYLSDVDNRSALHCD